MSDCNTPEYWNDVWKKWRHDDKKSYLKAMADRANTKEYWDEIWKSPKRRVEKYSMQRAWWHVNQTGAKSVLDVGCGNGRLLFGVKEGREVFGVDISQTAVDRMKREYGIDGVVMDCYDISTLDKKFDCIVANHMFEHVYRDEELAQKCKDLLNDGGSLFAAVPNDMSGPEETEEHVRKYNEQTFRELFEKVFGNCETLIIGNHLIAIGYKK